MSCIKCKNLESCGTINRWMIDLSKGGLLTELGKTSNSANCPDFNFLAISGTVLRDKINGLVKIASEKKQAAKQCMAVEKKAVRNLILR